MNRISDDPLVVALGQQKDRIYTARAGSGDQVVELHAYRDMLTRCDMPQHRLQQARDELSDRLEDGWTKSGSPSHERHWLALLVRYESVCDALDVPAARARLAAAETVVYLAHAS